MLRLFCLLILVLSSSHAHADAKQLKVKRETESSGSFQPTEGSTIDRFLGTMYDTYMPSAKCWVAVDSKNRQKYCMKINRIDQVKGQSSTRTFVLLSGTAIDERGMANGSHIAPGYVGAFVLEGETGRLHAISSDRMFPVDDWGTAPDKWEFVKIGAGAFSYGWKSKSYSGNQGISGEMLHILAPRGATIADIAAFSTSWDDAGHCPDDSCPTTTLDSTITFDSHDSTTEMFPLLITVTGQLEGRKIAPRQYTFRYNEKTQQYMPPEEYLLNQVHSQPAPITAAPSNIGANGMKAIEAFTMKLVVLRRGGKPGYISWSQMTS